MHSLAAERGFTHLLVYVPRGSEDVRVAIDAYNGDDRSFEVEVPRWISFWKRHEIVRQTEPTTVFYNISLKSVELPWQAYDISVRAVHLCFTRR